MVRDGAAHVTPADGAVIALTVVAALLVVAELTREGRDLLAWAVFLLALAELIGRL